MAPERPDAFYARPHSIYYVSASLSEAGRSLMAQYNRCRRSRDATAYAETFSSLQDMPTPDLIVSMDLDEAAAILQRPGHAKAKRYFVAIGDTSNPDAWSRYRTALRGLLLRKDTIGITGTWDVDLIAQQEHFIALRRKDWEPSVAQAWSDAGDAPPSFGIEDGMNDAAEVHHKLFHVATPSPIANALPNLSTTNASAMRDFAVAKTFFARAHFTYSEFLDSQALQERFVADNDRAAQYREGVDSELRHEAFEVRKAMAEIDEELQGSGSLEKLAEGRLKLRRADLRGKLDGLLRAQKELRDIVDDATETRAKAYRERLTLLQQRQNGGLPEGEEAIDDDGATIAFTPYLRRHQYMPKSVADCKEEVTQLGFLAAIDGLCGSAMGNRGGSYRLPGDGGRHHEHFEDPALPAYHELFLALSRSRFPITPFLGLFAHLVHRTQSLVVMDCHPQLIAAALLATLSRPVSAGGNQRFGVINGRQCSLGHFKSSYPSAISVIRAGGQEIPPADVVLLFESALGRYPLNPDFTAEVAIVVIGIQSSAASAFHPGEGWFLAYVSTEGLGCMIWEKLGHSTPSVNWL